MDSRPRHKCVQNSNYLNIWAAAHRSDYVIGFGFKIWVSSNSNSFVHDQLVIILYCINVIVFSDFTILRSIYYSVYYKWLTFTMFLFICICTPSFIYFAIDTAWINLSCVVMDTFQMVSFIMLEYVNAIFIQILPHWIIAVNKHSTLLFLRQVIMSEVIFVRCK